MEEEVIKLEDIFSAIKKRWLMIFLITLTFTVTAGLISYYVMKPEYQTRVKVFIGKEGAGTGNIDTSQYNSSDILMYQNLMKTYAEIVKSKDSVKNALGSITQSTSTGNINRLLAGLTVSPSADTQIMEVSYKTKNKAEILPVINSVIREFEKKSKELIPNGNIQIIETAEIPENPIGPNKQLNIIIGFMLGMMVSLGIVFLLEYLNNTIKNAQELEKILAVPVLGTIPDVDEKKLAKREKKARKLNTKN